MISMEEWSVVVAREAVSNSREKEKGCLARGMGNPPGYAPMHSRSRLLVLRSSEPGFVSQVSRNSARHHRRRTK